ncbi:MAG: hypothetical protein ACI4SL_08295 [Candidatus Ornithospirochaeta sp.]
MQDRIESIIREKTKELVSDVTILFFHQSTSMDYNYLEGINGTTSRE